LKVFSIGIGGVLSGLPRDSETGAKGQGGRAARPREIVAVACGRWQTGGKRGRAMADGDAARKLEALWGFGAVIGALVLIVLWILWHLAQVGGAARLLAEEGRDVTAEVVNLRQEVTRRTDAEGRGYDDFTSFVTVRFDTFETRGVTVEAEVDDDRYAGLSLGQRIDLRYAASDPQVIEFEPGEAAGETAFLRWVAIGLGLIAAVLAGVALRQYRGG
jgi:hypothetical protein